MAYNNDSLNNVIVKQLMKGVLPENEDIKKTEEKFRDENAKELAMQILKQDKYIVEESSKNYNEYQEKSKNLNEILLVTGNAINIVFKSVKDHQAVSITEGVENKIQEFSRITNQNEERIKKINEGIPEIQRKKKENDDFFKKLVGEKKVWIDRLIEDEIREQAYSDGFK
jgi:hypothetical protein